MKQRFTGMKLTFEITNVGFLFRNFYLGKCVPPPVKLNRHDRSRLLDILQTSPTSVYTGFKNQIEKKKQS